MESELDTVTCEQNGFGARGLRPRASRSVGDHAIGDAGAVNVLSIQSHVAYGHVGNASAVFPMQRMGVEVWPVHTVQFSNHTGYGAWTGRVFDGTAIEELLDGIADRGVLGTCDGVLSG